MEKLIIDRTKWLRGEGSDDSFLLRSFDKKMCCLGFDLLRRGFSESQILDQPSPSALDGPIPGLTKELGYNLFPTLVCQQLMTINDSRLELEQTEQSGYDEVADLASEADREWRIAAEFAKIGIEVEFIN